MNKTIITVQGTANVGKSMTLKSLVDQLISKSKVLVNNHNSHQVILMYKGVTVGIQTYGDLEKLVQDGLGLFIQHSCDIIVIASKGYGATVNAINNFALSNSYRVFWVSPYRRDGDQTEIKKLKEYGAQQYERMVFDIIKGAL